MRKYRRRVGNPLCPYGFGTPIPYVLITWLLVTPDQRPAALRADDGDQRLEFLAAVLAALQMRFDGRQQRAQVSAARHEFGDAIELTATILAADLRAIAIVYVKDGLNKFM